MIGHRKRGCGRSRFGGMMRKGFFGRGPWRGPGGPGFGPGGPGRRFGKGDLKYVILDLLSDRPAHGYDVMRSLEERFRGFYSPSAGSVYPTLQMLEDLGYVSSAQQDGKKVYSISDEGRKFLAENRQSVEDIWGRAGGGGDPEVAAEMREVWHEVGGLGKRFAAEMHEGHLDREKLRRIREVVSRSVREIEEILGEPGGTRI
jgi:DNA-binding PadR family transcriptional regulator